MLYKFDIMADILREIDTNITILSFTYILMLNFQFIIITFWSYGFSCLDYIYGMHAEQKQSCSVGISHFLF